MSLPLINSNPPQFRIGNSDRTIGGSTGAANGFVVVNTSNSKVFIASGGVWISGGTLPNPTGVPYDLLALIAEYFSTNKSNLFNAIMLPVISRDTSGNEIGGIGYRVCNSDRSGSTTVPNGFISYNLSNGNVWQVQSGSWVNIGLFPQDLYAAWLST